MHAGECSALPMRGGALIESSHDPSSSGYMYDSVPLGRAMMEHDTTELPSWGRESMKKQDDT